MIVPLVLQLLRQSPLTADERAVLLDQFHNLEPHEELAWVKFLEEQPNFFNAVGLQVRKLGNALLFYDRDYLNQLRQRALTDSLVLGS